jgi:U4/U6.U5 tri-snRNP-associated protein 2
LTELLSKYDGSKITADYSIKINKENKDKFDPKSIVDKGLKRKFSILKLPKFLILHVQRFVKNDFFVEKNPTIVNFELENLDLTYLLPEEE